MKFAIDQYAHLNSPIHRWNPKYKLIGLLALMFAFASVEDGHLIPAMLIITGMLYKISNLPLSFLLSRLSYPGIFLLGVVGLLPFISGSTILWELGPITLRQEGCLAMLLMVSRFLSIFTTGIVLFGTSSFLTLIKTLRSLGLSPILSDMLLISYRYLFELAHQFKTMQQATLLRGFKPHQINRRNLQVYAALAGSLFVRSYHQSEQVYKAMQLRGYGSVNQSETAHKPRFEPYSAIGLIIALIVAGSFIGFEIVLS